MNELIQRIMKKQSIKYLHGVYMLYICCMHKYTMNCNKF